ncbi:hypothetical protein HELRODRAFT_177262 [Helobdella robusta]|uniref:Tetraspanin n=1 Tax=Helobdella robusta TaxID=6412 RepID=T1FBF2_HELRO|nr:hypothetical protein HELRODRAFT_177262 [Helobdella robusta]ESN98034.1 hypothetical protein HELRODRAFT_177262 [Helobdella robusta]
MTTNSKQKYTKAKYRTKITSEKRLILMEIKKKFRNLNASAAGENDERNLQKMAYDLRVDQREDTAFDEMAKKLDEELKEKEEEKKDKEDDEDEDGKKKKRDSDKSDEESLRKKRRRRRRRRKIGENDKNRQFHFDREEITLGIPRFRLNEKCRFASFIFMSILNFIAIGPQIHVTIKSIDISDLYKSVLETLDGPDTYVLFDYFTLAMSLGVALHISGFIMCVMSVWIETRSYFLLGLPFYGSLLFCTALYCTLVAYACYEWAKHLQHGIAWPLEIMLRNYYYNETQEIMMNYIQQKFHCCGVTSFQDWLSPKRGQQTSYDYYVAYHERIPSSCCDSNYDDRCIIFHEYIEEAREDLFEGVGINMAGCESIIRKDLLSLFQTYMFYELLIIIVCDFFLVTLTRFLTTSINNSFRLEVPEISSYGYGILIWHPDDPARIFHHILYTISFTRSDSSSDVIMLIVFHTATLIAEQNRKSPKIMVTRSV